MYGDCGLVTPLLIDSEIVGVFSCAFDQRSIVRDAVLVRDLKILLQLIGVRLGAADRQLAIAGGIEELDLFGCGIVQVDAIVVRLMVKASQEIDGCASFCPPDLVLDDERLAIRRCNLSSPGAAGEPIECLQVWFVARILKGLCEACESATPGKAQNSKGQIGRA